MWSIGSYASALHSQAEAICAALIEDRSRIGTTQRGCLGAESPSEEEERGVATTSSRSAGSAGGYQLGVVHVKAVDDASRDRMVQMKVR